MLTGRLTAQHVPVIETHFPHARDFRKTKIVCTIGPNTSSEESLEALAANGMNVARLNMSHGTHDFHQAIVERIRKINHRGYYNISIMLDTKGPEVRSGDLRNPIEVQSGEKFIFTVRSSADELSKFNVKATTVNYDGFVRDVQQGDRILVDGGIMQFRVVKVEGKDVVCECIDGGTLASRRHLNIFGRTATLPCITDKDWEDIEFGLQQGVDFFALSFIKRASDIEAIAEYLQHRGCRPKLIAKIETSEAVANLGEIIQAADGAMVARGDLGAEIPLEEVPIVQEEIVERCTKLGKPCIVATQLLESMIQYPTPTRAEVTDITQAVRQRADALMLSGETASGAFPLKAVSTMHRVAHRVEKRVEHMAREISYESGRIFPTLYPPLSSGDSSGSQGTCAATSPLAGVDPDENARDEMAMAALVMAQHLQADGIVVFTHRGHMASLISRLRPPCPIFAFTTTDVVKRSMMLQYGVVPFRSKFSKTHGEATVRSALLSLARKRLVGPGSTLVLVSTMNVEGEFIESIQVRRLTEGSLAAASSAAAESAK